MRMNFNKSIMLVSIVALSLPASALSLAGGKSGSASINFYMPTTLDPSVLTITSLQLYSKTDNGDPITGSTFVPSGNANYGLQVVGDVPFGNNATINVAAIKITFKYQGTIDLNAYNGNSPNGNQEINPQTGKPYVPWSISGSSSNGYESFLLEHQPGSADLDIGAFYSVFQGASNDPNFLNAPVTINGYTSPPPVPELSSVSGLIAMLGLGSISLRRRKRQVIAH